MPTPFEGTCQILKAGFGEQNTLEFFLKDVGTGPPFERWYKAKPDFTREYLAIALTAISTNKRVFAKMTDVDLEHDDILYFGIEK